MKKRYNYRERYWVVVAEIATKCHFGVAVIDVRPMIQSIEQRCNSAGLTVARIIDHYPVKHLKGSLVWSASFPYRWGEMGSIDDELFGFFGSNKPNRARLQALDEKIALIKHNKKRKFLL